MPHEWGNILFIIMQHILMLKIDWNSYFRVWILSFEVEDDSGCYLTRFLNSNKSCVPLWLAETRACLIYLLFLLFICSGPGYIIIGPLVEWVRGSIPPWPQGQGFDRNVCTLTIYSFHTCFIVFIYFPIVFSLWFYFLTLLFLLFWRYVEIPLIFACRI